MLITENIKLSVIFLLQGCVMVKNLKDHLVEQSYQILKKQKGHVGRGTVRSVTLYVIETLFLQEPELEFLRIKADH